VAATWQPATDSGAKSEPDARILEVVIAPVTPQSQFVRKREFTGLIVASRESNLSFKHPGRVVELLVDDGDEVQIDQVLGRLDVSELEARKSQLEAQIAEARARFNELKNGPREEEIRVARANVDQLSAELKLAQSRHARNQSLLDRGTLSHDAFNESQTTLDSLAAQHAAAVATKEKLETGTRQEQIDAQEAMLNAAIAARDQIDVQLKDSELIAPFAGTISARNLDEGTIVSAGQTVLQLVESSVLEFRVGLPPDIADWIVGQSGVSHSISIGGIEQSVTLDRVLPALDPATRTRTLVFRLDSSVGLVPGQTSKLTVSLPVDETGIWLPNSALVGGIQGLWSCYVLLESEESRDSGPVGVVEQRDLEILHVEGERSYVRGTLVEGDLVIIAGPHRVSSGQQVRGIRKAKGNRE
jgi:RND family efflux transporter MFP subunit